MHPNDLQPNGDSRKVHPNETGQERALGPDPSEAKQCDYRRMTLCKWCCDALARGRYPVRRVDLCRPRIVQSCQMCHSRTRCGTYDVGTERFDKVERVNWRTKLKNEETP